MTNDSTILAALKSGLYKFFGKTEEDTTPAELDNLLQNSGTLEEIQQNAKNEALLNVQAKMDDFESRLNSLEQTVAERDQTIAQLQADVTAKDEQIETLNAEKTANETIIQANNAKIKQLSGEISTLKVSKSNANDDGGGQSDYQIVQTVGNVVEVKASEVKEVNSRLGFN